MKYAIAIVAAALIGLVGLGLIAAQDGARSSEPTPTPTPEHVAPYGPFERTWGEDGQPTEWAE